MRIRGINLKQSSILNLLFAGFWAGFAIIVSGLGITLHNPALGVELIIPGTVVLVLSATGLRLQQVPYGLILRMALIRAALLAIEATRMILAVQALGMKLPFIGAATFAISSVAGSTVSLVPAGMGIREGVVALLSPIIGFDPAVGFLSAAIDRTITMACLVVLAGVLLFFSARPFRRFQIGRKRIEPGSFT